MTNDEIQTNSTSLIHLSKARREIELASTIDEVKEIRDKAEALRVYVKQTQQSLVIQNQCAEIRIRAERRAGEMLAEMDKNKGGWIERESCGDVVSLQDRPLTPKLSEFGISRKQSSRWQAIAAIPVDLFEQHILTALTEGKELTSSATIALGKRCKRAEDLSDVCSAQPIEKAFADLFELIASGMKFNTVYADPPWKYDNQATRSATDNHYPTMTPAEIAELPIQSIVGDNAHLHIWTTNAFLFETKEIIEAWGFTYKSAFVWVKPQMGIGNYWRVSHEYLLLGVKGSMPFSDHSFMSWQALDRTKHSEKPDQIRKTIEIVSPAPRIELFGRKTFPGWTTWGNEIEKTLFNGSYFETEEGGHGNDTGSSEGKQISAWENIQDSSSQIETHEVESREAN